VLKSAGHALRHEDNLDNLQTAVGTQPLAPLPQAERLLSANDPTLAHVIASQQARWPASPTEEPIWGLIRIIMAQQISTGVACRLAERVKSAYPMLTTLSATTLPDRKTLRALGLSGRRAECCITVVRRSDEIRAKVKQGQTWEYALAGIKGIGPWTRSVFRIMVLREPDELPSGDVGLERAVTKVYGEAHHVEHLAEAWRPFRSVACWYLWRTLGNEQLG
jgi:DNA-3-methyladenine glycosylase II